jgi:hypothetical protein
MAEYYCVPDSFILQNLNLVDDLVCGRVPVEVSHRGENATEWLAPYVFDALVSQGRQLGVVGGVENTAGMVQRPHLAQGFGSWPSAS